MFISRGILVRFGAVPAEVVEAEPINIQPGAVVTFVGNTQFIGVVL